MSIKSIMLINKKGSDYIARYMLGNWNHLFISLINLATVVTISQHYGKKWKKITVIKVKPVKVNKHCLLQIHSLFMIVSNW